MDKKELEKGMEGVKEKKEDSKKGESKGKEDSKKGESKGKEDSPAWSPSIDWVMGNVGPFFNNNRGIGELLLDKISEAGINTEGTALAGMVNVLQQFSKEYKMLGEALGDNIERINELSDQSEDLAQAVKDLIKDMGISEEDGASLPVEGDTGAPPADMGGGMPPPDMGAPPADMGMAPDMGGGMPPPDMGAAPPPANPGLVSDEGMKSVKRGVLSDEQLKNVAGRLVGAYGKRMRERQGSRLSPNIIGACAGSDL